MLRRASILCPALAAAALVTAPQTHAELLFEYLLNETGTMAVNTGTFDSVTWGNGDATMIAWNGTWGSTGGTVTDLHSADGLGLTGLAGDRAFDNTASMGGYNGYNSETSYYGGVMAVNGLTPNFDPGSLTSFTFSAWLKPESGSWGVQEYEDPDNPGTFLQAPKVPIWEYWDSSSENVLFGGNFAAPADPNKPRVTTEQSNVVKDYYSTVDAWDTPEEDWIFVAFSHDGSAFLPDGVTPNPDVGTVKFYGGTKTSAVTLLDTIVTGLPNTANGTGQFTFGNDRNLLHAFDGWMDNIRIHDDELLDTAALEALRASDLGLSSLTGDLNGDGFVGQDDLNIVLGAWGTNVTPGDPLAGDPSGDGFVGQDDLNDVLAGWGQGTPPSSLVPEPASAALLALGGLAMLRRRR